MGTSTPRLSETVEVREVETSVCPAEVNIDLFAFKY